MCRNIKTLFTFEPLSASSRPRFRHDRRIAVSLATNCGRAADGFNSPSKPIGGINSVSISSGSERRLAHRLDDVLVMNTMSVLVGKVTPPRTSPHWCSRSKQRVRNRSRRQ